MHIALYMYTLWSLLWLIQVLTNFNISIPTKSLFLQNTIHSHNSKKVFQFVKSPTIFNPYIIINDYYWSSINTLFNFDFTIPQSCNQLMAVVFNEGSCWVALLFSWLSVIWQQHGLHKTRISSVESSNL